MMRVRAAMVLLALAAMPEVRHFRYERSLTVQTNPGPAAESRQTCAVLDAGLYQHAAPGLADVRVFRGTGRDATETPYAIRQAAPRQPRPRTISLLNLGRKGSHTTFEAEMPAGQYSDVDLDISAKDFVATVAVTGAQSDDGREGTELGLYTIFDLTAQKLGRSTVLHLPESNFRYLYFGIAGPVKPEDLHGLSVERIPAKVQYVTVAATSQVRQKGQQTILEFQVPAHVPVERVEFLPGAQPKNFSRAVTVEAEPVQVQTLPSGTEAQGGSSSGNLLRLHATQNGQRIDEERLAVDAPSADFGDDATRWTVTIDNGDDVPLTLQTVQLEMAERKLCFDAAPGAIYMMMYGDAALTAPRYDYATLFSPEARAAVAALGPEQANPEYSTRPDTRPFTERHPVLLWLALILVIIVLGGVALKTAKDGSRG
ncbi:MAG TPA: DUF3999 family protein [Acidobacteriaceae bacterium]